MDALMDLVERYGVRVVRGPLEILGCWLPHQGIIRVNSRLTPVEQRCVLAHELGHVHYGHLCSNMPAITRREARERQADRFAARLLISPIEYARHERINPDHHTLAEDLGVTIDLIDVYERHCLTQVRGLTYTHAREGINQWAHRAEVA